MWSARQEAAAARQEAATATAAAAEAAQHRAQLAQMVQQRDMDLVMATMPGDFSHEHVRGFFRREYMQQTSGMGDQAPAFDTWIGSNEVKTSPLYSRFFQAAPAPTPEPATTAPAYQAPDPYGRAPVTPVVSAPAPVAGAPPNINSGAAGGGAPPSTAITPSQIRAWGAPGQWQAKRDEARASLAERYPSLAKPGGGS